MTKDEIFKALVGVLFLGCASLVTAEDSPGEVPGYKVAKLDEIKQQFESYYMDGRIPNYAFGLYSNETLLYSAVNGRTSIESGSLVDLDTIYWMASMTKPVVSAAVMKLVDEGRLQLDDPLSKYFPQFSDMLVAPEGNYDNALEEARTPVTLRHLISHTSGFTYGPNVTGVGDVAEQYDEFSVMNCRAGGDKSLAEHMEILSQLPLIAHPGEAWNYSVSIDVLGAVIEKVVGIKLDSYLEKEFFEPLAMQNSAFYVPQAKKSITSRMYTALDAANIEDSGSGDDINWKIEEHALWKPLFDSEAPDPEQIPCASGGGGLWTSVNDYGRFMQMILNGGVMDGVRVMSENAANSMLEDQTQQLIPEAFLTAFGNDVSSFMKFTAGFGAKMIDEVNVDYYFWGGYANTFFWMDKAGNNVGVFATHLAPSEYNVSDSIEEIVDQARN